MVVTGNVAEERKISVELSGNTEGCNTNMYGRRMVGKSGKRMGIDPEPVNPIRHSKPRG